MKKLQFSINIQAPKEKIWKVLWKDETYRNWTSVFSSGSYAITDWKEGSKVLFLTGDGDGMFSVIAKSIPNEHMSIKHLGMVKDHKEQPVDEEAKKWSGSLENYTLKEKGKFTTLIVDIDAMEGYEVFFSETFPKALNIVKDLSENKSKNKLA